MAELSWLDLYTTDPAFNLAAEQYVFDCLPRDRSYFMLWQNDNAVIIGKYQNTQAEINEKYVREHGIRVVRRLSGGGAVYHDLGNLNFTFIGDAGSLNELDLSLFCRPVIRALSGLGIRAELNGRNDMTIDGKKFSGNAQYMRGGRIMHHGTLMFDSDLRVLTNALNVDPSKIESKGMKSVRSRVTNIKDYAPIGTTLADFRKALIRSIAQEAGGTQYVLNDADLAAIRKICDTRYALWDWNYGKSPAGTIKRSMRFDGCGRIDVTMETEHGCISSLAFRGDFFSTVEPSVLSDRLLGTAYDSESLRDAIKNESISDYFKGLTAEQFIELMI